MPGIIEIETSSTPMCHIVTPVGMMGYGFDEESTAAILDELVPTGVPTAIIMDAGSTDSGPNKLALGDMSAPRTSYERDLSKLCKLIDTYKVPLLFTSAGGDGTDEHVQVMLDIIDEICAEEQNAHYKLKTISVYSGIDKSVIRERLRNGKITGCGSSVPELTEEDINDTPRIVGQMGPEPYVEAMRADPDFNIIAGGRSYDPSGYIAYCIHMSKYHDEDLGSEAVIKRHGGFAHMGKLMECGGQSAEPKSSGAYATIWRDGVFEITPMEPTARCTPVSVAAHTLYEKSRPDLLAGPGGVLDLTTARYEQLPNGRTVRVYGSSFKYSTANGKPYQLKLEGAKVLGFRSMFMGGFKDPILIGQLDTLLARVKAYVKAQHKNFPGTWDLDFHVHGKEEVFIVGEAIASTQKLASSVAMTARIACVHAPYEGQKATSGNFAFGVVGKMEFEAGPCTNFSVYHLMDLEEGEETLHFDSPSPSPEASPVEQLNSDAFPANGTNGFNGDHSSRASKSLLRHSVKVSGKGQARPASSGEEGTPTSAAKPTAKSAKAQAFPTAPRTSTPQTVGDLAKVLRSKCSGPYEITFDILFSTKEDYDLVKDSNILNNAAVAKAVNVSENDLVYCGFFEPALAFKATIPRIRRGKKAAAGSFMENDVHGSQEYLGLTKVRLPETVVEN